MKVKGTRSVAVPVVTANGVRLVSHAGVGMLAELADLSGLTGGLTLTTLRSAKAAPTLLNTGQTQTPTK